MKTLQAATAKARFSELLDEVEAGQSIAITRHGKRIARLIPEEDGRRADARKAMAEIQEMRKNAPGATIDEILAWRDEGRR